MLLWYSFFVQSCFQGFKFDQIVGKYKEKRVDLSFK